MSNENLRRHLLIELLQMVKANDHQSPSLPSVSWQPTIAKKE